MPTERPVGRTALVVDDNAAIRKKVAGAFLSHGFAACAEAGDGLQGIAIAKQITPDVITLDLSMPVMNGLDAASELRKLFPHAPIILLSLYADAISRNDATNAGVSLVLSKVDSLSTLMDKVNQLMEN